MKYQIKYQFDPGSGICLWSNNEASRLRYGYPINHWELNISENTKRYLQYLITWFDTSIDWSAPSDFDDYWSRDELDRFRLAAKKGLDMLRLELSGDYSIIDAYEC